VASSDVVSSKLLLWFELPSELSLELLILSRLVGAGMYVEVPCDVDLMINISAQKIESSE
jgi:hypothetical protein